MTNSHAIPTRVERHLHGLRADVSSFRIPGAEPTSDAYTEWLTAHYVATAREAAEDAGDAGLSLEMLHKLSSDIVPLRRGDHRVAHLQIHRDMVEIERERTGKWMEEKFEQWLELPEVQERFESEHAMSEEERGDRIREILRMHCPICRAGGLGKPDDTNPA